VATISRLPKIIGLFCRIQSLLQGSFANETYNYKEPTNRSFPYCHQRAIRLCNIGASSCVETSSLWSVSHIWPRLFCKRAQQEEGSFPIDTPRLILRWNVIFLVRVIHMTRTPVQKSPTRTGLLSKRDLICRELFLVRVTHVIFPRKIESLYHMGDTHQKELPTYQVSFGKEPCSCWALLCHPCDIPRKIESLLQKRQRTIRLFGFPTETLRLILRWNHSSFWCFSDVKWRCCVGSLHIRSLLEKKPVFVGLFLVFLWWRVALLCRLPTYQVSFGRKPCVCWALLQKSPGHMGDTHAHADTGRGGTIFLDAYLSVRRIFSLCTFTCMCIYSAYRDL